MSNLVDTTALPSPQNPRGFPQNGYQRGQFPPAPFQGVPQNNGMQASPVMRQNSAPQAHSPRMSVSSDSQDAAAFGDKVVHIKATFEGVVGEMSDVLLTSAVNEASAEKVFKRQAGKALHEVNVAAEGKAAEGDLSKAIITKIKIMGCHNGFPYPVTFNTNDANINMARVDMSGKPCMLGLAPDQGSMGMDLVVYDASKATSDPVYQRYGHISTAEMKSKIQTVNFNGRAYSALPPDHEVINMIRLNTAKFGVLTPQDQEILRDHYCLAPERVDRVLADITKQVLSKFNFSDLKTFGITMSRPNGCPLNSVEGSKWSHLHKVEQAERLKEHAFSSLDLEITWSHPQKNATSVDMSKLEISPINAVPVAVPRGY